MKTKSKQELIDILQFTIDAIKSNDSFEGFIHYIEKPTGYDVEAFIRYGNSNGQGGAIIV
jgi:hypothetical protein